MTDVNDLNAYVILVAKIEDMDSYSTEYLPTAAETLVEHGGEVLVASPDPEVVEGEWDHNMTVVIGFPTMEAAEDWYEDERYQEAKGVRVEASEYNHAVLVPSFA